MGSWDYSKLTPKRRQWLEHLRKVGRAERGHHGFGQGSVALACMRSGWTEWVWIGPEGQFAGTAEINAMFGSEGGAWGRAGEAGWRIGSDEQLTAAGHRALAAVGSANLTRDA